MKIIKRLVFLFIAIAQFLPAQNISITKQTLSDTVKIAVISDAHYYSPSLGTTGKAFQNYLANDRKMIAESHELLASAISIIKSEKPSILLVAGDLTKDGEKVNHQAFAGFMKDIKNSGIKVFVIPGNHDVLNPESNSYLNDSVQHIPNVTPAEFAQIYSECGYGDALYRDPNSLSYIAEPVNGVWLFAMDACRYMENTTSAVTGGKFSTQTLNWILDKLAEAKQKNKFVIGMMHHGVVEHYTGQTLLFPDYVVSDYKNISSLFSANGMRYVFTGHYHAQDITRNTFAGGNDIYDIETGSLVTYPSPVRIVKITPDMKLDIYSKFIQTINYNTNGKPFPQYAKEYLIAGMNDLAYAMLTAPPQYGGYGLPDSTAKAVSPIIALAFTAHYSGDEKPDAATLQIIQSLVSSADPNSVLLGQAIYSLWTDLPPADNATIITPGTVIPVELTSFTAKTSGEKTVLAWSTATETNNRGFYIESRSESGSWSQIGFVKGNGNSTVTNSYSFTDSPGLTGKIYYRLKQIDFDGSSHYSNTVAINAGVPETFSLEQNYPNPFNPSTVISYSVPVKSSVKLIVTNILGREVAQLKNGASEAGKYQISFDGSKLSSGIYFVTISAQSLDGSKKVYQSCRKMMLIK
jgi:3',5'-cyclic AMP phosphodiesterase CpdA